MGKKNNTSRITLAAIDIGSNAARLLIKQAGVNVGQEKKIKKLLLLRVPLRLGFDVFSIGKLSPSKVEKLERLMKSFQQLMKIYEVDLYRACATSAMRDAKNGRQVIRSIEHRTNIQIDLISGQEEARIIYGNHLECLEDRSGSHLYVDVGGGSTEVNLLVDGHLRYSASYNVGTIRLLNGIVAPDTWEQLTNDLCQHTKDLAGTVNIIGTGGNINKLYRLAPKKEKEQKRFSVEMLRQLYSDLFSLDAATRAEAYDLKEDRADVIVPAAKIFLHVADTVKAEYIHVPVIGLADGIIDELYTRRGSLA